MGAFVAMGNQTTAALRKAIEHGRGGLGSVFVFAAAAGALGDELADVNYNGYWASRYTITVAGTTHRGVISDAGGALGGAALLASAPTSNLDSMVTISKSNECEPNFRSHHAPAALCSGVVALMLQANPMLTWLDVQFVIAKSSRKPPGTIHWTENAAGLSHHYDYGYGILDAANAVKFAKDWRRPECGVGEPPSEDFTIARPFSIPNDAETKGGSGTPVEYVFHVSSQGEVAHVEIEVTLRHNHSGNIEITVVSPASTTSRMARQHGIQRKLIARVHSPATFAGDFNIANAGIEAGTEGSHDYSALYSLTDSDPSGCGKVKELKGKAIDGVVLDLVGKCSCMSRALAISKVNSGIAALFFVAPDDHIENHKLYCQAYNETNTTTMAAYIVPASLGSSIRDELSNNADVHLSVLLNTIHKQYDTDPYVNWRMGSVRHFGEPMRGMWKVYVQDNASTNEERGVVESMRLEVHRYC